MTAAEIARLRAMVTPQPAYPAPWRVTVLRGDQQVVVCAAGHYTAECPTGEVADVIVAAVNAFATGLTLPAVRARAQAAVELREATPGQPLDGPYPASVGEVADELATFVSELDATCAPGLRARLVEILGHGGLGAGDHP